MYSLWRDSGEKVILLDAPIRAICGSFALLLFYLLHAKLASDVNLEVIAHSMTAVYDDVHILPPRPLMVCRYFVAVAIVEVVIRPVVEAF